MRLTLLPSSAEEIRAKLDKVDVWTVRAGLESMSEIIANAAAFRVLDEEGEEVGVYALRPRDLPGGLVVTLVAGQGGADDLDLTRDLLPSIESQVQGADFFVIQTTRAGLIKKLAAQGYEMGGAIMVKKLK